MGGAGWVGWRAAAPPTRRRIFPNYFLAVAGLAGLVGAPPRRRRGTGFSRIIFLLWLGWLGWLARRRGADAAQDFPELFSCCGWAGWVGWRAAAPPTRRRIFPNYFLAVAGLAGLVGAPPRRRRGAGFSRNIFLPWLGWLGWLARRRAADAAPNFPEIFSCCGLAAWVGWRAATPPTRRRIFPKYFFAV